MFIHQASRITEGIAKRPFKETLFCMSRKGSKRIHMVLREEWRWKTKKLDTLEAKSSCCTYLMNLGECFECLTLRRPERAYYKNASRACDVSQ